MLANLASYEVMESLQIITFVVEGDCSRLLKCCLGLQLSGAVEEWSLILP